MMTEKILLVLFYVLSPLLIMHLCDRYGFLRKAGPVLLAYFTGIVSGTLNLFETAGMTGIQDMVINISVATALPLLLFSTDLKKITLLARKTLLSLFIALVVVATAVFTGYFLFRAPGHAEFSKVGGLLTGVYTGGTPNLAALQLIINLPPGIYLAVHTYDMIITTVYLFFLMTFGKKLFPMVLPGYKYGKSAERNEFHTSAAEPMNGLFKKKRAIPLLKAFSLAVLIFTVSAGLTFFVKEKHQMAVFILSITTLSILASLNRTVRNTEKTFDLGMYFILIFSVAVASKIDFQTLSDIDTNIFFYVSFVVLAGLIFQVIVSSFFKIDSDTVIITSTALVCSPPFVPVIAGSLRNKEIILPGITVGIIGYAIGTYMGYLMWLVLSNF